MALSILHQFLRFKSIFKQCIFCVSVLAPSISTTAPMPLEEIKELVRSDGPPSTSVDLSRVENAIPQNEPINQVSLRPYIMFGRRYEPLTTANNYRERGIASWYGRQFHGEKTSIGDVYDMYQMTAAHKTLPLPSYVEVTNLDNGRKVVVRVNDRGPFYGDRLIDLSFAAASKLGMVEHGIARVDVQILSTEALPKMAKNNDLSADSSDSGIFMQLGVFGDIKSANSIKSRLERFLGIDMFIDTANTPLGRVYRVQAGPFDSLEKVDVYVTKLESINVNYLQLVNR